MTGVMYCWSNNWEPERSPQPQTGPVRMPDGRGLVTRINASHVMSLCPMSVPGNDPELFDNLGTFASGENARDHQLGVTF